MVNGEGGEHLWTGTFSCNPGDGDGDDNDIGDLKKKERFNFQVTPLWVTRG